MPHNMNEHTNMNETLQKTKRVIDAIAERGSILIAFSGGVDSSVLACVAKESGADVLAVTADSELLGRRGLRDAIKMADEIGVKHEIFDFEILKKKEFVENPHNRCYHCKKHLILELAKIASRNRIETIADGTNITDIAGDRPGYAAITDAGVFTPFVDFGLGKPEIREIARHFGLSVADAPSESCLATRIPSGTEITVKRLSRIEDAESMLRSHGFCGVRVRDHGRLACVEVQSGDAEWFRVVQEGVAAAFARIGFDRVVLSGLRSRTL
ncbi:MAG: ATP-dependent sacrificial sulfur transferase LarE [ANME-2 cluster archaeon]|nr:MAG: ATP-dependent sacrificial sulfur transferase LarE [ANME-2 cluster archaeon]